MVDWIVAHLPLIEAALTLILDAIKWAWDNILKPLGDFLLTLIDNLAEALNLVLLPAVSYVLDKFKGVISDVKTGIDKIKEFLGLKEKAVKRTNYDPVPTAANNEAYLYESRGFGINTNGLMMSGGIGALTLHTNINVTNSGTPIDEATIRSWGNTITDIVSNNLGRRM